MKNIKIMIDGVACMAESGEFLLGIAKRNNIYIPTLCNNAALKAQATCRMCLVEINVKGRSKLVTSCIYPVFDEIEVRTRTPEIIGIRKMLLKLMLAEAPHNDEIRKLAREYDAEDISRFEVHEENNCIVCGLCTAACEELGSSAISSAYRGTLKKITTPYEEPAEECIGCGSCSFVCPVEAIELKEENGKRKIWNKEFDMLHCSICGKAYITKKQYEFINKKMGEPQEVICETCKQKKYADAMIEIYQE